MFRHRAGAVHGWLFVDKRFILLKKEGNYFLLKVQVKYIGKEDVENMADGPLFPKELEIAEDFLSVTLR